MELILILAFVFMAVMIANGNRKALDEMNKLRDPCPPHKWSYEEIKDHEGVTHAWRLVCAKCGPLKPQDSGPRNMDY